jgi:hypothetical protein
MAKRSKWNPQVIVHFQEASELQVAKTLAELGELFYKEIRSRQLQNQIASPIAASSPESHRNSERTVADA